MIVKYNKNRKRLSKKEQFEKAVKEEVQKVLKGMDINEPVKALEPKQGVKEIKKELDNESSVELDKSVETNTMSNDEKEQSKKTNTTSDKPKRKRGRPRKETK